MCRILCYTFFRFFFIPLFKWNKAHIVRQNCYGATYACGKETADEMLATGMIDFDKLKRMERNGPGGCCPYCGSRVAGNFTYCPFCGNKL